MFRQCCIRHTVPRGARFTSGRGQGVHHRLPHLLTARSRTWTPASHPPAPKPSRETSGRDNARSIFFRRLRLRKAHATHFDGTCHARLPCNIPNDTKQSTGLEESNFPLIPRRYAQWLVGYERGCASVCHCRPTARRARLALIILRWLVNTSEFLGGGFEIVRRLIASFAS